MANSKICIQFSFYTILFLLLFSHATSQLNHQEQAILLNLKQHWKNPHSLSNWTSSNSSHCIGPEITCSTDGRVTGLSLMDKNLAGTLPNDIHRMARLRRLNVGANSFFENISPSIGQLTELRSVKLFEVLFNGSLPQEIGNLSNLEVLLLAYKMRLSPTTLPLEFTKLKKLKYLLVASANLVGEIPYTIGEMAALERLDLSMNNLRGNIPSNSFMLKNLSEVYLFKSNLAGEISWVVDALNIDLVYLSVIDNLTGTILDDFKRLNKLFGLSLSINQLSGKIPPELGLLKLTSFNLSSNHLTGRIASELENDAYGNSFLNNPYICTNRLSINIGKRNSKSQNSSETSSKLLPWILGLVIPATLLGLVASFLAIRFYRKRKQVSGLKRILNSFQRFTFTEFDILSELTENNVIGCGGSGKEYCVSINNPSRDCVAGKWIWSNKKLEHKLEKGFLAAVKIPSSIRHSNIVKLKRTNAACLTLEHGKLTSFRRWLCFTESDIRSCVTENDVIGHGGSRKVFPKSSSISHKPCLIKRMTLIQIYLSPSTYQKQKYIYLLQQIYLAAFVGTLVTQVTGTSPSDNGNTYTFNKNTYNNHSFGNLAAILAAICGVVAAALSLIGGILGICYYRRSANTDEELNPQRNREQTTNTFDRDQREPDAERRLDISSGNNALDDDEQKWSPSKWGGHGHA